MGHNGTMEMTIDNKLQSYGIAVTYHESGQWDALVSFHTPGKHGESGCIEGTIGPKYIGDLIEVVRLAKSSAESIGIGFEEPNIYVENDGETPNLPQNWRSLIAEASAQLGWTTCYLVSH